jgi:hypothetical protein
MVSGRFLTNVLSVVGGDPPELTEFQGHCRRHSLLRLAKHFHVNRHGFVRGGRQQREEVAGGFAGFGVEG